MSLSAVSLWLGLGKELAGAGGVAKLRLDALEPPLFCARPATRAVIGLRWGGDRQLQFNLTVTFSKPGPIELDLAGVRVQLAPTAQRSLGDGDWDGAFAGVSGKTFDLSVWHDDRGPAVARTFVESEFMTHARRYAPHLKVRAIEYGFDAQLGLLSSVEGENLIKSEDWFDTMCELGLYCCDEAAEGAVIASEAELVDRDMGRILEAPGLVWRESKGQGRIRGGNCPTDVQIRWGWPERKIKGRARGG